ncbi:hypothetical protein J0S82_009583, partial [Galemys pyrenaicus]
RWHRHRSVSMENTPMMCKGSLLNLHHQLQELRPTGAMVWEGVNVITTAYPLSLKTQTTLTTQHIPEPSASVAENLSLYPSSAHLPLKGILVNFMSFCSLYQQEIRTNPSCTKCQATFGCSKRGLVTNLSSPTEDH